MGTISLSHKVVVFEGSSHIEPSSGDVELYADNGTWTIEHNNSECEQHITVTPESGSSDDTIHINCDGTPKAPGGWALKFFLDDIYKATLNIYAYSEGNVPDPPIPEETAVFVDPICKKEFSFLARIYELGGGEPVEWSSETAVCPNCGISLAQMEDEMAELEAQRQWDEEKQDYYIEMWNETEQEYIKYYYLMNQIIKSQHDSATATVRKLGG